MEAILTQDELINIIADTLAETGSAEWLAEVANNIVTGVCTANDDGTITWNYDDEA